MSTAIVWFRRDLRLHDHPALSAALRGYGKLVPVFVFDPVLLAGRFYSPSRTAFMLGCLEVLDRQLRERGSRLVIRRGPPERELSALARQAEADAVLWTSDVSPYARGRDGRVTEALRGAGVQARPHGGNYVVDVSRPRTEAGDPYSVFSPFFRAWKKAERRPVSEAPVALPPLPEPFGESRSELPLEGLDLGQLPSSIRALEIPPGPTVEAPAVAPGELEARRAAERWLSDGLASYGQREAELIGPTSSTLSPYLRWGCLSALELERRAAERGGRGADAWIRQLCWRDFYAHVLLHWPQNARHEFQDRFRSLEWDDDPERLAAWQAGQTGYPLVDAGMRELARTGWMHNRARLVVGSFLTKDLHLDWRLGERWFERLLLDGEPAQNNGNWQWIASVGTDPAPPYRRLYNPTRQAQRLDPGGTYIRRWVPELSAVPDDRLIEPWTMSDAEQRASGCRVDSDYPAPIVDHLLERRRALERYGAARAAVQPQ